jgi:dihydroflavonol-4-reductase
MSSSIAESGTDPIAGSGADLAPVLVTGGSGYVAGWCIATLLKQGHAVRATVRSLDRAPEIRAAMARAGLPEDTDAMLAAARDGTQRVLRAAVQAGVLRVVMTSAAAAARAPVGTEQTADETMWTDLAARRYDPYRVSKVIAEREAWAYMAAHGGRTQFCTILPGAVFGPVLTPGKNNSAGIIAGLLHGKPPRLPRFGFFVVDVRDLAELHVRAMTAPAAAGQRFLATGEFMWMGDVARVLRAGLGDAAAKVPTRAMPDFAVRVLAVFLPSLRMLAKDVGRINRVSSAKAQRLLGFAPRPARQTVLDCAASLPPR